MSGPTNSERLAVIETRLDMLPEIRTELKALREEVKADKDELAALKNKGAGILIGVGAAGGTIGAAIAKGWAAITGAGG